MFAPPIEKLAANFSISSDLPIPHIVISGIPLWVLMGCTVAQPDNIMKNKGPTNNINIRFFMSHPLNLFF
jgi:hypothetical protein